MYVNWIYVLRQCLLIKQTPGEDGVAQTFGMLEALRFFLVYVFS